MEEVSTIIIKTEIDHNPNPDLKWAICVHVESTITSDKTGDKGTFAYCPYTLLQDSVYVFKDSILQLSLAFPFYDL